MWQYIGRVDSEVYFYRSRSEMSVTMEDSMTSSHIGSQSGSESGLLGSVSSLNDQDGICEQEPRTEDYVPQPGKVVSHGLIIYRPTSH